MCISVIAYKSIANRPLLIASNRDEFHERPTQEAHSWQEHPQIFAGRDLQNGGTWFGAAQYKDFFKVAFVTNYRDPALLKSKMQSRGHIAVDFLKSEISSKDFSESLLTRADQFNPFNFICFGGEDLYYVSSIKVEAKRLSPGIYVICNHHLDTPWPKVERLRASFKACEKFDSAELLSIMQDRTLALDELLPATGLNPEWEKIVSSIFIVHPRYGTRSTTIFKALDQGNFHFEEVYYNTLGAEISRKLRI